MKKTYNSWSTLRFFAIAFWACASPCALLSQTNATHMDSSSLRLDKVVRPLAEFEKTKSVDQLQAAMEAMEQIPHPTVSKTSDFAPDRRQHTKMWLKLLATLEHNLDPKFDSNEVFQVNIVPPRSGDVQFPAGVDPKAIPDPAARAEYEAALKANKEKAERYGVQLRLRRMHRHVTVDVERALRSLYRGSREDKKELGEILDQSELSASQKQKLKVSSLRNE